MINHIDRDRSNNRLENLEIVTKSENSQHAIASGTKLTKCVTQLDTYGNIIAQFNSIKEASDATNVYRKCIGKVANGKQKTAGGFVWRLTSEL